MWPYSVVMAIIYGCGNSGYYGQGTVFRAIGNFFAAEKQQAEIWYPIKTLPAYKAQVLRRKTTRTLLAPQKNKGWKGKR